MKPEEAISSIKNNMPTKGTYNILTEGLELAVQALENQIPKKPTGWNNECWGCGWIVGGCEIMPNYCPNCGQAIKWEVGESEI